MPPVGKLESQKKKLYAPIMVRECVTDLKEVELTDWYGIYNNSRASHTPIDGYESMI